MNSTLKIGLALGSGSSRGWSHIGIINALNELGIEPDIICGTSIGALVGASYASGKLSRLQDWATSLNKFETARFLDVNATLNGFVDEDRLNYFLNKTVANDKEEIESLSKIYASVSTDLETGREIWLTKGSLIQAVWASISLPGLFPAIKNNNKWLVDGGLVNPVPVSVCRALGADIVIAVNLNGDIVGKHFQKTRQAKKKNNNGVGEKIAGLVKEYTGSLFLAPDDITRPPGLLDTIASSINITQDRITRSRMAGDPPDLLLTPKLSHIGLLEFYRAHESIDAGMQCVMKMQTEIEAILGID